MQLCLQYLLWYPTDTPSGTPRVPLFLCHHHCCMTVTQRAVHMLKHVLEVRITAHLSTLPSHGTVALMGSPGEAALLNAACELIAASPSRQHMRLCDTAYKGDQTGSLMPPKIACQISHQAQTRVWCHLCVSCMYSYVLFLQILQMLT